MQTLEQRRIYDRNYRAKNLEKYRQYHRDYRRATRNRVNKLKLKKELKKEQEIKEEIERYVESMPVPFGSFEKAKYVCFVDKFKLYSFVTTCRNTEECISLMKKKVFLRRKVESVRIYKIQHGIRKLIFKEVL